MSKSGMDVSFKYNDSGIRTQKTVNGVTTNYYLDGDRVTYEDNGTDKIYYTYDASRNLVSMNLNGVEYYYIRNAQGDIIGLFDKSGTTVASYTYDSWGKLISIKNGSGADITNNTDSVGYKNQYRYRGYRYDNGTGLYYLNSRYYNPELGRFVNADAILFSYNMFSYCRNNPVNMSDDSGYNPLLISMTVGAGIGALINGGINVAVQLHSHQKFSWKSLGVALISGAASGALTGSGLGLAGFIAGNGAISAGSYMATCGSEFNWHNFALSIGLGVISGGFGGKGAFQDIAPALEKANVALAERAFGGIKQSVCDLNVRNAASVIECSVVVNSRKTFGVNAVSTVLYNKYSQSNNGTSINSSSGGGGGGRCYQMIY